MGQNFFGERGSERLVGRKIMMQNTGFGWSDSVTGWIGLSRDCLKELVGDVSESIGITCEQAKKIAFYFNDHAVVYGGKNKVAHIELAACYVEPEEDQETIRRCTCLLNRSIELLEFADRNFEKKHKQDMETLERVGIIDCRNGAESLFCMLDTPRETVIWFLAEEIKHAQIKLMAKTGSTIVGWNLKYIDLLRRKGKTVRGLYAANLEEVAVSRVALRVLAKLSSPKRAKYFRGLYRQSLQKGLNVTPDISKTYRRTFVRTGFDPRSILFA